MTDSAAGMQNSARVFSEQAKALPIGEMVRDIAMGVAQAQAEMDRSAVGLLREFGKKNIDLYGDGKKQVSLLELGFAPQFLFFQKVSIKVHMELKFHVEEQSSMNVGASLNAGYESESKTQTGQPIAKAGGAPMTPTTTPTTAPAPTPTPEP